jgi:hypothetical protein
MAAVHHGEVCDSCLACDPMSTIQHSHVNTCAWFMVLPHMCFLAQAMRAGLQGALNAILPDSFGAHPASLSPADTADLASPASAGPDTVGESPEGA